MTSLSTLMCTARDPSALVACSDQEQYSWQDFQCAVASLTRRLQSHPAQRWLLHEEHSYRFAIGLMALLHSEKTIVLPPSGQPGILEELSEHCDAMLGPEQQITVGLLIDDEPCDQPGSLVFKPLDAERCMIEVMTSGSSGDAQRIIKSLASFDAELSCQAALWGSVLTGTTVMATVSHQHIYGLLFRLLLPLSLGCPFWVHGHAYPEQLFVDMARLSSPVSLVSSPALLARLPERMEARESVRLPEIVFSSGGPLLYGAAQHVERLLGQRPVEIFGSTETGGVGWRRQQQQNEPWQLLPGVTISADDGLLRVHSAYCCYNEGFTMGDRVQLGAENQFSLLGRADRIVKIEEKRLSLDDMEARLKACALVDDARLLVINGHRQQLAAVVVPTAAAQLILLEQGKRALNDALKLYLLDFFERVLLPRKWRYPTALPYNSQGKLPLTALTVLFTDTAEQS